MENTKKIVLILISILCIACKDKGDKKYFNENGDILHINKRNVTHIKSIIYQVEKDTALLFDRSFIHYYKQGDSLGCKIEGKIIIDTIYDQKKGLLVSVSKSLDIKSFVKKTDQVFKDRNQTYFLHSINHTTRPLQIIDLNPTEIIFLKGYLKDKYNVYCIDGQRVVNADANTFKTIELKDTANNSILNYGIDKNTIYFNSEKLTLDALEKLNISQYKKHSLKSIYYK